MLDLVIRLGILASTGTLFLIIFLAYRRVPSRKMAYITAGFGLMFVHAVLLMPEVMLENITMGFTDNTHLLVHLVALLLVAIGILRD